MGETDKQTYVSGGNSAEKNRAGQGESIMERTEDIYTTGPIFMDRCSKDTAINKFRGFLSSLTSRLFSLIFTDESPTHKIAKAHMRHFSICWMNYFIYYIVSFLYSDYHLLSR